MNLRIPNPTLARVLACLALGFSILRGGAAVRQNPDTDWFRQAGYGLFMHVLPGDDAQFSRVRDFDVEHLATQVKDAGAGYLVITLGQNSGYFIAPNAEYDRVTGYAPGERCSARDLPMDLARALEAKGLRLMLYLPCQAPNRDARAQRAFGLREGPADQPLDAGFAARWAAVIREWSDRYGPHVAGWWFDGGYAHVGFDESVARVYAAAAKHGNPKSIVTFNPGVRLVRHTESEDYTAGELNEPFSEVPKSRWVDGSQWHALTYLGGGWGARDARFDAGAWARWVQSVVTAQGVVTLDVGPNWNPADGPVGSLAEAQMQGLRQVRAAVRGKAPGAGASPPKRLRRAESYFGLHFDFHAGPDCTEIGKGTTRESILRILDAARPDYVQVDTKGHAGFTSYPTRVGNQAPGFVGDLLRLWRDVTAERGVALYVHHSGVWDSEAIRRHPEWAVRNADGSTNANATSFFGGYAEGLLIPQLREMAGDYGVDGAWVDGECWASQPDFGEAALRAFTQATGIREVPRRPGQPNWFEFLEFHREAFRGYLRRYLASVRATHPQFQLCSNWAFSDHMPEAVSADVDWISGDFSPEDAVNSARLSARYLVHQGRPWDLMAWSFVLRGGPGDGRAQKPAVQLQREAALVLSQGGGFQFYHTQRRDGSVPEEHLPVIGQVAAFCRERQPFCEGARPVPQVAFLYSTAAHYRAINSLFGRDLARFTGTLQALIEAGQVVDLVSEHSLRGRMAAYPLIVVGEGGFLDDAFRQELLAYVRGGGQLLLIGPGMSSLFAAELGVTLGESSTARRQVPTAGGWLSTAGPVRTVSVAPGSMSQVWGRMHEAGDAASPASPAVVAAALGKGRVVGTWFDFSRAYLADRAASRRDLLAGWVKELFPTPEVRLVQRADVDLCLTRQSNRRMVHVLNTGGVHWDPKRSLTPELPPTAPLGLVIRSDHAPARVTLQPGARALAFAYEQGEVRVEVPPVAVHSIVVLE